MAAESWVSRKDTNADRIIEALDKHTGEELSRCHRTSWRRFRFPPDKGHEELKRVRTITVEPRGEQGGSHNESRIKNEVINI